MRIADEQDKGREQHLTTWSVDYAFMIDNGDLCTREEIDGASWLG